MGIGPNVLATITAATTAGGAAVIGTSQLCEMIVFTAVTGNSGTVYIGDSNISATRYMYALTSGQSIVIQQNANNNPGNSNFQLSAFYAFGGAASQKLNVTYFERLGSL